MPVHHDQWQQYWLCTPDDQSCGATLGQYSYRGQQLPSSTHAVEACKVAGLLILLPVAANLVDTAVLIGVSMRKLKRVG